MLYNLVLLYNVDCQTSASIFSLKIPHSRHDSRQSQEIQLCHVYRLNGRIKVSVTHSCVLKMYHSSVMFICNVTGNINLYLFFMKLVDVFDSKYEYNNKILHMTQHIDKEEEINQIFTEIWLSNQKEHRQGRIDNIVKEE